jgi:hypothetical protein
MPIVACARVRIRQRRSASGSQVSESARKHRPARACGRVARLVGVVELIVHEACDDGRLANALRRERPREREGKNGGEADAAPTRRVNAAAWRRVPAPAARHCGVAGRAACAAEQQWARALPRARVARAPATQPLPRRATPRNARGPRHRKPTRVPPQRRWHRQRSSAACRAALPPAPAVCANKRHKQRTWSPKKTSLYLASGDTEVAMARRGRAAPAAALARAGAQGVNLAL